jgi:hypothetical protein
MLKTKIQSNKNKSETTLSTTEAHGESEQPSQSQQTSTSTMKKTARSKTLSKRTARASNTRNTNGNGILATHPLKVMVYPVTGEEAIKNIGLLHAELARMNNIFHSLNPLMQLHANMYANPVMPRLVVRIGE